MATQRRRNRQAVSQTREDRLDFKKNRAAGDKTMTARAMVLGSNVKRGGPNGSSKYLKDDPREGIISGEKNIAMPKNNTVKRKAIPGEKSSDKSNVLKKRYPANEEALKATLAEKNAAAAAEERDKLKRARGQSELKHDAYVKGKRT